ncbi:methionyl-tRNA formyltransferase [Carnobacterium iners]|uniref:Methionyl-tRNA formyltransferase n=1 Tax=Carnobacterium iners TaxID=1073423 RepID=A0A1X7NL12_9LACT|nr:methionyl-tRNA formyltransferase [Carnobacterium iners]SEK83753.1 methionyl-tRNA formyltransferase [Carnobacterium iners]SMH37969.1 methionyl-tRNA formyltransferase [Carnobacterium iners]
MTKIVFMGTPAFSVPILEALIEEKYEILAVVTQPDRPVGRKKVMTQTPVKIAALKQNLIVLQPEKITGSDEMTKIIEMKPDLLITAAFGQFLPQKLLNTPKYGAINVHASLLPKYRGGAPVHYALIKGEKETGVTIMYMEKKMDAGLILSQRSLEITESDDVGTLFERLSALGKELLIDTLPDLLAGKIKPIIQDEEKVTFSPNIKPEQERIDWTKEAKEIDCQVRGMRPWPVTYTIIDNIRVKIWDTTVLEEKISEEPGVVVRIEKAALVISCGNNTTIQINELQPAGKSKMTTLAYLTGIGSQVTIGEKVGENGN